MQRLTPANGSLRYLNRAVNLGLKVQKAVYRSCGGCRRISFYLENQRHRLAPFSRCQSTATNRVREVPDRLRLPRTIESFNHFHYSKIRPHSQCSQLERCAQGLFRSVQDAHIEGEYSQLGIVDVSGVIQL